MRRDADARPVRCHQRRPDQARSRRARSGQVHHDTPREAGAIARELLRRAARRVAWAENGRDRNRPLLKSEGVRKKYMRDHVAAVLYEADRPLTRYEIELRMQATHGVLSGAMRDDRLKRVAKGRWALRAWGRTRIPDRRPGPEGGDQTRRRPRALGRGREPDRARARNGEPIGRGDGESRRQRVHGRRRRLGLRQGAGNGSELAKTPGRRGTPASCARQSPTWSGNGTSGSLERSPGRLGDGARDGRRARAA